MRWPYVGFGVTLPGWRPWLPFKVARGCWVEEQRAWFRILRNGGRIQWRVKR